MTALKALAAIFYESNMLTIGCPYAESLGSTR